MFCVVCINTINALMHLTIPHAYQKVMCYGDKEEKRQKFHYTSHPDPRLLPQAGYGTWVGVASHNF
jgi:hypothetical protein